MTVKTQVSADLQVRFVSLIRALHYPEPPTCVYERVFSFPPLRRGRQGCLVAR